MTAPPPGKALEDATTGGEATLKCGVQLDVLTGAITALDLVNGRAEDRALPLQQQGVLWMNRLLSNAVMHR